MINDYEPRRGEYVKHKFKPEVKGIFLSYDFGNINVGNIKLHDGSSDEFKIFIGNLEPDIETYREYKIKELLCQEK